MNVLENMMTQISFTAFYVRTKQEAVGAIRLFEEIQMYIKIQMFNFRIPLLKSLRNCHHIPM